MYTSKLRPLDDYRSFFVYNYYHYYKYYICNYVGKVEHILQGLPTSGDPPRLGAICSNIHQKDNYYYSRLSISVKFK